MIIGLWVAYRPWEVAWKTLFYAETTSVTDQQVFFEPPFLGDRFWCVEKSCQVPPPLVYSEALWVQEILFVVETTRRELPKRTLELRLMSWRWTHICGLVSCFRFCNEKARVVPDSVSLFPLAQPRPPTYVYISIVMLICAEQGEVAGDYDMNLCIRQIRGSRTLVP